MPSYRHRRPRTPESPTRGERRERAVVGVTAVSRRRASLRSPMAAAVVYNPNENPMPTGSAPIHLTYAGGLYDRTEALIAGRIQPEGITLNYVPMYSPETFWRMLRYEEFDASELSCANYFVLRSRGDTRYMAIPVFPSRTFRHNGVFVNTSARIEKPEDLKGKRVGCAEYAMTMAVWVRGFLQHDYGVLPSDCRWVFGGIEQPGRRDRVRAAPPPGVRFEQAPPDRSLVQMLEQGEIDALLTPSIPSTFTAGSPRVARLFPRYWEVEADYFRRTGTFPIMHTVVLRRDVYERHSWAAQSLFKAFSQSRDEALRRLSDTDTLGVSLAWQTAYAEQERALAGGRDLFTYGLEENRPVLEALKTHLQEQGLLERDFPLESAFAPSTHAAFRH